MLTRWHLAVSRARTLSALLSLCDEFLASWTPAQLADLPPDCRPSSFRSQDDIQHWVGVLAEALCAEPEDGKPAEALRYMLGFLFSASDRAAELAGGTQPCANDDPSSLPTAEPAS